MSDETQEQFREKAAKLASQIVHTDTDQFSDVERISTLKASAAEVLESYEATK